MTEPTRGEFDLLKSMVQANEARIGKIDDGGTKGVAVVQSQLTDLTKDVIELRADMASRFAAHEKIHEQDKQARLSGRRWLIGTGIAAVATAAAVIGLLIELLHKIH